MALAFAGIAMVSFAQEAVTSEVVVPTLKKSVITNSFWSNWFLSVNGGYQLFNGVVLPGMADRIQDMFVSAEGVGNMYGDIAVI